jgi:hypothetical protein
MATPKDVLPKLLEVDGCIGSCLVDSNSGMLLGTAGGTNINLEVAAAGDTEVVRAKRKTMKALGQNEPIEDIVMTVGKQYHLIRPLSSNDTLFLYMIMDRTRANLGMARYVLSQLEKNVTL